MFSDLFENIHFIYIFIVALPFLAGIYTAPYVIEKEIKWLLAYPRWMARFMTRHFSNRWGFIFMFIIILFLNNFSLFTGFLSGFLIFSPIIFSFLTGFHVAVISFDMMGWQGIWHLLVNPVAWLEFPAAWISFAMDLRISMTFFNTGELSAATGMFGILLPLYFKYVFILLVVAALLESFLIGFAEKHKDEL